MSIQHLFEPCVHTQVKAYLEGVQLSDAPPISVSLKPFHINGLAQIID